MYVGLLVALVGRVHGYYVSGIKYPDSILACWEMFGSVLLLTAFIWDFNVLLQLFSVGLFQYHTPIPCS